MTTGQSRSGNTPDAFPGNCEANGPVRVHAEPNPASLVVGEIGPNENFTVIGKDPTRRWLHITDDRGVVGWIPAQSVTCF
jgi:hypothetical protein